MLKSDPNGATPAGRTYRGHIGASERSEGVKLVVRRRGAALQAEQDAVPGPTDLASEKPQAINFCASRKRGSIRLTRVLLRSAQWGKTAILLTAHCRRSLAPRGPALKNTTLQQRLYNFVRELGVGRRDSDGKCMSYKGGTLTCASIIP